MNSAVCKTPIELYMPLINRKNVGPQCEVIIWKIEESVDELLDKVAMHDSDFAKFRRLNNEEKQREFLALRCCLADKFGTNPPVFYTKNGKPYLDKTSHISFSHTRGYAGMIISNERRVGIDLEMYRDSFRRIAPKFISDGERKTIQEETETEQLIHYWGAKEVMVKITGNRRHNFKQHLRVAPFIYRPVARGGGMVVTDEAHLPVQFVFDRIDNLHLTYGWEDDRC